MSTISPPGHKRLYASMIVLALVTAGWWAIMGMGLRVSLKMAYRQWYVRKHYVSTVGTVFSEQAEATSGQGDAAGRHRKYYRYTVDGREYQSSRSTCGDEFASGCVPQALSRLRSGSQVEVHYDPQDPSQAVLQIEAEPQWVFILLFLQPFLVIGLVLLAAIAVLPAWFRRLRTFLRSPAAVPWRIPTWGTLVDGPAGLSIQNRSRFLPALASAGATHGLICFAGAFAIMWYTMPEKLFAGTPSLALMVSGGGAALVIGAYVLSRRPGKARLTIDVRQGWVSLTSPKRDIELKLSDVDCWCVTKVPDPRAVRQDGEPGVAPLLAMRTRSGEEIPVHVFRTSEEAWLIARKAAEGLAELTGKRVEEAPAEPADRPAKVPGPRELISMMFKVRGIRRRNKALRDLT